MTGATRSDRIVLLLDRVSRHAGRRVVLAPVSLRLGAGAVCLVTGANGAGKTTLLRVAAGLLRPTAGRRAAVTPAVYLRPGAGARRGEASREAVRTAAALAGVVRPGDAADRALDRVGLATAAGVPAGALSAGERARLAVAVALAVRPPLLCLDEPLEHLDAAGRDDVRAALGLLAADGCALLVASHHPDVLPDGPDARLHLVSGSASPAPLPGA